MQKASLSNKLFLDASMRTEALSLNLKTPSLEFGYGNGLERILIAARPTKNISTRNYTMYDLPSGGHVSPRFQVVELDR